MPWAVATSGLMEAARPALELLEVPPRSGGDPRPGGLCRPDPDLFLATERLGADMADAVVVGDSIWDLLAARRSPGAGGGAVVEGGYGREELERAGAYRVYDDPADLLAHLDESGPGTQSGPYLAARTVGQVEAVEKEARLPEEPVTTARTGWRPWRAILVATVLAGLAVVLFATSAFSGSGRSPDSSGGSPAVDRSSVCWVQQLPRQVGAGTFERDASLDV